MTSTDALAAVIADVLTDRGPTPLPALVRAVKAAGAGRASRTLVERALTRDGQFTREEVLGRQVWSVDPCFTEPDAAPPVSTASPLEGLDLRDWQIDAFAAWATAGCQGVVEAVTGTGKTRLAIAAVRACLAQGGRALVIVPTLDLLGQWRSQIRTLIPGARVGQLGGGCPDDLFEFDVVIATPHSAAAVPVELPHGAVGLLVADEAHRYGAPTWGEALKPDFLMRLALTATYERNDDGLIDVLGPYFGGVVAEYTFADAAGDGVIAPFDIELVGVPLTAGERSAYDKADARVRDHRRELVAHGLPKSPLELIAAAAKLSAGAEGRPNTRVAREVVAARAYLSALRGRRDVAAQAGAKLAVVQSLAGGLATAGTRTLVFTDTVEQAEQAAVALRRGGVQAEEIHGDLPGDKRRIRLAQFANGNLQAVTAPRVLDEGVDVPDAELAVVLAAFRTRRQMIQRLGRVLRLKPDGRAARLVIAYAIDTREDPANGAQEDFLAEVADVARSVTRRLL
ncbi:DEAD/DEAH box helicase [Euzebya tangerina]|uniref:DEAD/DEAH box helicase n=1 Tax=Euzebya tangerina TaxID=591198 RepID=UPI0013C2E60F|nr:DEAD/DEAH box helicase [Euzebya tangerina]